MKDDDDDAKDSPSPAMSEDEENFYSNKPLKCCYEITNSFFPFPLQL